MNKVLFIVGVMLVGMTGYAQTTSLKKEIEIFLTNKEGFNQGVKPIFVTNLDSIEKVVNKKGFNFMSYSYSFRGEVRPENEIKHGIGGVQSVTNFNPQKFIYYNFYIMNDIIVVQTVIGHKQRF